MPTQQYAYPFDPNGTAPSNKVVGERHTISPVNGPDFRFLIPRAAPFFRNSLKVTHVASGRVLQDGVDYQPGHRYDAASNTAPFLTIFGSILIMDNSLVGAFDLEYQTLGAEHTLDEQIILQMLANTQLDPRLTKWDLVLNTPGVYDPLLHRQHAMDTVGYDDMVVALNRLFDAIIADQSNGNEDPVARSHIANTNNPHQTRLSQLPDALHLLPLQKSHIDYLLAQETSGILRNLDIAETTAEETAIRNRPTESFQTVFDTWERIAWSNNNPQGTPAELNSWQFDSVNNQLVSTVNSTSMVGFISPETVSGNYHFELELESNDADDDIIGVFLGKAFIDNKWRNLIVQRSASVNAAGVYLTYDYRGDGTVQLAGSTTDLVRFPNGWLGYKNAGIVRLKVIRTGSVIEVWTTNPGTDYLESSKLTFDLATVAKYAPFIGPVNLGYIAASQRNARYTTIRRTGSKLPIANLQTKRIYEFDGLNYVEVTNPTFANYLAKGRFYNCKYFSRLYYAEQNGVLTKLSTGSGGGGNGSVSGGVVPITNQLKAGDFIIPDNSAGIATYLMPTTPADLATIAWMEGPVSFATNKLVLQVTDKPIMGLNENFDVTSEGAGGRLVYFQSLGYWKVYLDTQGASAGAGSGASQVINRGAITSPTSEQAGLSANFTMTCTPFGTTPELADSLLRYTWQVATDTSFNNLLWQTDTLNPTATVTGSIPANTRVYIRVRSVGASRGPGEWSPLVTFVVAGIAGPTSVTIAGAQLASGGVTHQFTVNSTAYSGGGTHAASQFQVLNGAGTVVYDSGELAGAIVSHKPFDNNFRPVNLTDYIAQVRYKLATGQWTQYTSTALRTGNGASTAVNTTVQTWRYSDSSFQANTSWFTVGGSNDFLGAGPNAYRICDSLYNQGPDNYTTFVCDPANPEASRPPLSTGPISVYPSTWPRTVVQTTYSTSEQVFFNTTRSTQHWTEW